MNLRGPMTQSRKAIGYEVTHWEENRESCTHVSTYIIFLPNNILLKEDNLSLSCVFRLLTFKIKLNLNLSHFYSSGILFDPLFFFICLVWNNVSCNYSKQKRRDESFCTNVL